MAGSKGRLGTELLYKSYNSRIWYILNATWRLLLCPVSWTQFVQGTKAVNIAMWRLKVAPWIVTGSLHSFLTNNLCTDWWFSYHYLELLKYLVDLTSSWIYRTNVCIIWKIDGKIFSNNPHVSGIHPTALFPSEPDLTPRT